MKAKVRVDSDTVSIDSIQPYPSNPRRGDLDVIATSLRLHGQYRPIVVHRETNRILAGNHTWRAAKSLGWKQIAVTWVLCSEEEAARIMLADNRASDLATYDDSALVDLLRSLPDLDGTGFDRYDLESLEGVFDTPLSMSDTPTVGEPGPQTSVERPQIRIGHIEIQVDPAYWVSWSADFAADRKRREIVTDIRQRLGLMPSTEPTADVEERHSTHCITIDIDEVHPYPRNARQGDIGAISESLRTLGQYRPIVVNKRTDEILVGNHTWQAARSLGWRAISVTYVDVDDEQAARIVAVDNRSSDLATYDDEALIQTLTSIPSIEGTGFSMMDVDDLLHVATSGGRSRRPAPSSRISCVVGKWAWKSSRDDFSCWTDAMSPEITDGSIYPWIAMSLGLDDGTWEKVEIDQ